MGAFTQLWHGRWHTFRGSTSPYMMLDYGLLGVVLMPIAQPLLRRGIPLPLRAVVYMLGIFLVEYVSGILFHKALPLRVWDYTHIPYNLHGQIAPPFIVPWVSDRPLRGNTSTSAWDACALLLVNRVRAEDLETLARRTRRLSLITPSSRCGACAVRPR